MMQNLHVVATSIRRAQRALIVVRIALFANGMAQKSNIKKNKFMKQVTFNYKQDIETLHPDFPITAEFSVTAEVAHDESEEVRITHIEARVYTPFGGSEHWENLPIPEEKPFNRETGFLLALLRSKARDVAYTQQEEA